MKRYKSFIIVLVISGLTASAQQEKKDIREGNRLFKSEKFSDSEIAYRKAIEVESNSIPGSFNLGDALYRQEKFEDAGEHFNSVASNNVDKSTKSQALHNLGNSLLQAGQLEEAIEAYKNALRNIPNDMDTKYNLAYAQNLLKQQQEQEQEQEQEDQNQDNKDQQDQQDQQDNKEQDQKEQEDQQNQQDQKEDQNNEDQQQQQQPQEGKISKEDAQRLLEALANDEKKVQEKVKEEKAKARRVRVLKDW